MSGHHKLIQFAGTFNVVPCLSSSQSRGTIDSDPQFRIKEVCMFCVLKKYHVNTTLIIIQYHSVIDKFKKKCKVKNDTESEM